MPVERKTLKSYSVFSVTFKAHRIGGAQPTHRVWDIPETTIDVPKAKDKIAAIVSATRALHVRHDVASWRPFLRDSARSVVSVDQRIIEV